VKGKLTSRISLTKILMEVNMINHKDVVSWALEKDDDYSTKSLYRHFRPCLDPLSFYKNRFLVIVSKNWFFKKLGGGVWILVSKS
jgi:hypothetical protein